MRAGSKLSPSPYHLPTNGAWSLVSKLVMVELVTGAGGTEISNKISALAGN